jgi:hypothetical protein
VSSARIVETLDELEDSNARFQNEMRDHVGGTRRSGVGSLAITAKSCALAHEPPRHDGRGTYQCIVLCRRRPPHLQSVDRVKDFINGFDPIFMHDLGLQFMWERKESA